jgi:hypothetical protein
LENPPFISSIDFTIKAERDKQDNTVVSIRYICEDDQYFVGFLPPTKSKEGSYASDFAIAYKCNPGELSSFQHGEVKGKDALLSTIKAWTGRLAEDLAFLPEFRTIAAHEALLRELDEKLKDIPDGELNEVQARQVREMLDEVQKNLATQIKDLEISADEKAKKIDELRAEVDALRANLEGSKLRATIRSIAGRLIKWGSDPRIPQLIDNGRKIAGVLTSDSGSDPSTLADNAGN